MMIWRPRIVPLILGVVLLLHPQPAAALGDTVTAASCAVAAGGNASNNTVTCNFGLTDEQLRRVTQAAVSGATTPLLDRIEAISKTLGVTTDAAKTLLKIAGEQDVSDEKLAAELTKIATDYKRLRDQATALNPTNPTAQALVAQANAAIDGGNFARAHELLRQATQAQIAAAQEARKLREQAQAAEDAQMLGAASSTAAEGGVAMTERHYAQAADLFRQAAALIPSGHPDETEDYLNRQADALYRDGDERGHNDALNASLDVWRRVLEMTPRDRAPLDWAMTQTNLGNALKVLGERESGTASLEAAVAAYRAALEEQPRDRVPLDWARVQTNLGNALEVLGERESGTASLEAAVAAFRAALEEQPRDRVPLDWAMTQTNLGNALAALGEREGGTASLEAAVAAYRAALEEQGHVIGCCSTGRECRTISAPRSGRWAMPGERDSEPGSGGCGLSGGT